MSPKGGKRTSPLLSFGMGVRRTIHRLSAIGSLMWAAAFFALLAVQPNRHAGWQHLLLGQPSAWIVWAILAAIGLDCFVNPDRSRRARDAIAVSLASVSIGYVAGHIALKVIVDSTGEYWSYLTDFGVFRWLLAPWYAAYAMTLLIGCIGMWIATGGGSHPSRQPD